MNDIKQNGMAKILRILVVITILGLFLLASFPEESMNHPNKASLSTITWPLSGFEDSEYYDFSSVVNTWVRINGSDPGYPLPYNNTPPCLAANWFRSTCYTPKLADYDFDNLTDEDFWGPNAQFYIIGTVNNFTEVADAAVSNSGIRGFVWDDFPVSEQSPSNMSTYYTQLHHEDGNLIQGPLSLILVLYQRDYYDQTPYTWSSIDDYFDGVSFWYYPNAYGNLWEDFYGFEDAFYDMRQTCGEDKEYWLGIYLHYYPWGTFPWELTYQQLGISLRAIKWEYATRLHILENQHIRVHPESSTLVWSYLESEWRPQYETTFDGESVTTTSNSVSMNPGICNVQSETQFASGGWRFYSEHFQTITLTDKSYPYPYLQEVNTGRYLDIVPVTGGCSAFIDPNTEYRIYSKAYTPQSITTRQTITTPTTWENKAITISAKVFVNASFTINNCIIHWSVDGYVDTVKNGTPPIMGLTLNTNGVLTIFNSTISPTLRQFPYYLNMTNETYTGGKGVYIYNSTVAAFGGKFHPTRYVYICDSVLAHYHRNGDSRFGLYMISPGRISALYLHRNTFFNNAVPGSANYICPGFLPQNNAISWRDNQVIGGDYPIELDSTYATNPYTFHLWNTTIGQADSTSLESHGFEGQHGLTCEGTGETTFYIYVKTTITSEIGAITGILKSDIGTTIGSVSTATSQSIEVLSVGWHKDTGTTNFAPQPYYFTLASHPLDTQFVGFFYRSPTQSQYSYRWAEGLTLYDSSGATIYDGIGVLTIDSFRCPQELSFNVLPLGCISPGSYYIGNSALYPTWEYTGLSVTPSTTITMSNVVESTSVLTWTVSASSTTFITYTVTELDSSLGYRAYKDGKVIATGTGPTFVFTATGGGDFEIEVWYGSSVSVLVVLAVDMVGVGIFVSVVFGFVMPTIDAIRRRKELSNKVLMNNLMKVIVFIVIGLILWRMLHEVAIG